MSSALATRLVPPVKDQDVAVEVLDEAHVAHARVVDADHLVSGRLRLLDRSRDVLDAEGDARGARLELEVLLFRTPETESDVRRLQLTLAVSALGQSEDSAI